MLREVARRLLVNVEHFLADFELIVEPSRQAGYRSNATGAGASSCRFNAIMRASSAAWAA